MVVHVFTTPVFCHPFCQTSHNHRVCPACVTLYHCLHGRSCTLGLPTHTVSPPSQYMGSMVWTTCSGPTPKFLR